MNSERCQEMHLLIQADVDGELTAAEAARVAVHLGSCAACAATQANISSLSARLREDLPYRQAPLALREAVGARIAALNPPAAVKMVRWRLPTLRLGAAPSFGAGFAFAACLALMFILPRDGGTLAEAVVADHIRSLQPGHLMDVVSTDRHTVKPWFDGKLAFAPPVKDFQADGFPLAGGRLDYLDGREVAALVYQSRKHVIGVFIWPNGHDAGYGPTKGSRNGYNFVRWSHEGMVFWAVSDLNAGELADFVRLWQSR